MATIEIFRNEPKLLSFASGETIFQEGDSGSEMFAIVEGSVEIQREGKHLATLGAADVFGEMALIDHHHRSATAVARSDCKVAAISAARFTLLVQQTPYFALQLLRVLTERLRRAIES